MKIFVLMVMLTAGMISIAAQDVVLTFRRDGKDFADAYRGLKGELQDEVTLKEVIIDKKSTVENITAAMKENNPKLVVLMDNNAIGLYRKYQAGLKDESVLVPSISLMGVMIKAAIKDMKMASGISYEIPIVTSLVSLRSVLGSEMKKVGVIHREFLEGFMEENAVFCKKEGIEVVSFELPNKCKNPKLKVKKALKELAKQNVDALWVANDNALLQPTIIQGAWIPFAKKYKIPVVVGVEVLVKPKLNFGTFAVLPDHVSLGSQAAEMVFELMDNDWEMEEPKVDPPLAVYKIINLPQARKYFKVSDDNLKSVDKKLRK